MLDFAGAYNTLASGGYKQDTHFINKVEDLNGNIIYLHNEEKNQGRYLSHGGALPSL